MRRWRNFTVVMVMLAAQALFAHEVRPGISRTAPDSRQYLRCVVEGAGGGRHAAEHPPPLSGEL